MSSIPLETFTTRNFKFCDTQFATLFCTCFFFLVILHELNFVLPAWCLESSELQLEKNKDSTEKNQKRKLKTPAQQFSYILHNHHLCNGKTLVISNYTLYLVLSSLEV